MLVKFHAAVPVSLRLSCCHALVLPALWALKVRRVGLSLTPGPVAVPLPVRLTVWGLLPALSVMVRAPVRVPVTVGVKLTLMVQLPPAATDVPQVLFWP